MPNAYVVAFFDYYTFEAEFLNDKAVQRELKLNQVQIAQAAEFLEVWQARIAREVALGKSRPVKPLSEREATLDAFRGAHTFVAEKLLRILEGQQRSRFREIMIQQRMKTAGLAGVCSYPGMAELAKFGASQVEELRLARPLGQVLDAGQVNYARGALGQPFKEEVVFDQRGLFAPPRLDVIRPNGQAARASVDLKQFTFANFLLGNGREMNLTKEQIARLQEIADDAPKLRTILHRELSQLPPPTEAGGQGNLPEARAYESLRKALHEQCMSVLDAKQQSLLKDVARKSAVELIP